MDWPRSALPEALRIAVGGTVVALAVRAVGRVLAVVATGTREVVLVQHHAEHVDVGRLTSRSTLRRTIGIAVVADLHT